ncbi:IclR family transcriptional regulator [Kineococcus rhizosphaerae]|uniref:IclR family transcriptional regulator n=1 Tax=Kineococcus rhizosphaerae TaxID=559628 RepID=A0A2T0QUV9_9ACTN|nr:IclR family transcriptional regulator [Kineococcus rhizosphaerae]PRY09072.1 IclR family transcriptional regulator [Kineococcus rhizosphaerae]
MTLTSRTLDLLSTFTRENPSMRLGELADAAGLPLTTTHRIVADLLACGALERDASGALHIGLRLWEIGSLAPRGHTLREVALPYLEDLYVATRENVQLAVREGLESVFVERLTGRTAVTVMTRVGARFALTSTGVGRALLAHAPAAVQEEALARPVTRWTEHTETDPVRLRAVLAEVRRTGVAVSDREVTDDAVSVAAPVRGPDGEVVAAVSLVVRSGTVSTAALVPAVRAAALGVSRSLGAPSSAERKNGWREAPGADHSPRTRARTRRAVESTSGEPP